MKTTRTAISHRDAVILSCRNALARAERRLASAKPGAYETDRLQAAVEHRKTDLEFALKSA